MPGRGRRKRFPIVVEADGINAEKVVVTIPKEGTVSVEKVGVRRRPNRRTTK